MVLAIDALRVGSAAPPQSTLDVSGSLGTGNAGIVFAGLPANAAAVIQNPVGQTTVNSMLGQTVQFADNGVVGLKYSQSSLVGNLSLVGGLDGSKYDQVFRIKNSGLAGNSGQSIRLAAMANGQSIMDTQGTDLTIAANGVPGLIVSANGATFATPVLSASNIACSNLVLGLGSIAASSNGILLTGNCIAINQPNPTVGAALDCLGNVHLAGGGLRIDGTNTAYPDLSLGYPGTFSMDSSGTTGGRLTMDNNGKMTLGGQLAVGGAVNAGQQINLVAGQALSLIGDSNHILKYDASVNGPRLQGYAGGVLGTSQTAANALAWTTGTCTSYLPFTFSSPVIMNANATIISTDPYLSIGRSTAEAVFAVSDSVNAHSNVAVPGDLVLKSRSGANVVIQTTSNGPGLYLNSNNALGVQTTVINPLAAMDVGGLVHTGVDNVGSRMINLVGQTYYSTTPTWRQIATFYPNNNSGNGAHLTVTGPCGSWTSVRSELKLVVTSSGSVSSTAQWLGGTPSGVDVKVFITGGVASVWIQVLAAYASYNFDVVYGGQGYTSIAQPETTATPPGTVLFSALSSAVLTVSNAGIVAAGPITVNNGGVVSTGGFVSGGNVQLQKQPLLVAGINDTNHKLVYDSGVDGPSLWGYAGGKLSTTNTNADVLKWTNAGINIAGAVNSSGTIQGATINSSGGVTAGATIQGATINSSGGMTAGGTIQGATVNSSGSMTASGTIQGATINSSGGMTASGTIQGATINSSGALTASGCLVGNGRLGITANPTGIDLYTYSGQSPAGAQINATDDGNYSAHVNFLNRSGGSGGTLQSRMYINGTSGFVGINKTNPQYQIDCAGSINTSGSFLVNGSPFGGIPTGSITAFGSSSAPAGWLTCDGSAVSRSTYSALYGVIGTTYGSGDGSTTFNVPNLGTAMPVGYQSGNSTYGNMGRTGGEAQHTLSTSELPQHSHGVNDPSHQHQIGAGGQNFTSSGAGNFAVTYLDSSYGGDNHGDCLTHNASTGISVQTTGGGSAHNNMPPYVVLLYIIKT